MIEIEGFFFLAKTQTAPLNYFHMKKIYKINKNIL